MTDAAEGTDPADAPTPALREALAAAGCGPVARAGDVWAVRMPDGTPCTVQVVPDGERRDELDERIRALRGIDHPHVARIETVVEVAGQMAIVLRGARGPTLAEALARREPLGGREAVALAVALAQGLVAMHREGLVHGPLAPEDIVIDAAGRAHLRPRVRPAPRGAVRHDDVRALARLVAELLDDQPDDHASGDVFAARAVQEAARVRTVLLDVIAGAVPIEAGTFAALVAETVEAEPIRVPDLAVAARALADTATRRAAGTASAVRTAPIAIDGGPGAEHAPSGRAVAGVVRRPVRAAAPPTRATRTDSSEAAGPSDPLSRARRATSDERRVRRRRRTRRRWTATAVAVVLVAGVGTVVAAARIETKTSAPAAAAVSAASDDPVLDRTRPQDAARELTLRRERMLAGAASADDVTVVGSPARAADDALVAAIAARGRLRSVPSVRIAAARAVVEPTSGGGATTQVRVDVTYAVGATTLTTSSGGADPVASVASRTDRLDLVWTATGWRVRAVE